MHRVLQRYKIPDYTGNARDTGTYSIQGVQEIKEPGAYRGYKRYRNLEHTGDSGDTGT